MSLQLQGTREITWVDQLPEGLNPSKVFFGRDESGVGEVQIAIATVQRRPTQADLQAAWKTRGAGLTTPVIVAAVLGEQVWLLGPSQSESMLGPVPLAQAMRQLQTILDEVDAVAARQKMQSVAHSLNGSGSGGFVNHFLFATYHLRQNVPQRKDWKAATERAQSMLPKQGRDLINSLGYELETVGAEVNTLLLRASSGSRRAVAVLLDESQEFDRKSAAYQISPVAHGLEVAGREDVPWVIVLRKSTLRLYPGKDGVGVGQRGQSETYFELDLNDLDPDYAGLLTLIFSADALEHGGTAEQILEDSSNYAAELGTRLRDRVYVGVVPSIAVAISERLPQLGYQIDAEGLKVAYALTLRVLFRLLFQAYGEDTGLLPAGRNEGYDSNSLQSFIRRDLNADHSEYSDQAKSIWFDLEQVWDAIYNGNARWAIPAYGGSLFDPETEEGALLKKFELPDSVMGPALQNLLAETTEDGVRGPVDFRSLQVRDFGTIYEGLLESSLSVAESDLTLDNNGAFVPAKPDENVEVVAGRPYFHSSSGDRKATGSYYTPKIVVDHLIERSITPTLTAHLNKVKALIDAGQDREAGELFWDFRVADLAMGSAHFLVAAVDKIERGMRDFLTTTPVPSVRAELSRLSQRAREQLAPDFEAADEISDAQLLRRQIARRCVYGVDINPLAVELARLAIWIHTFVPGLPISSLDHNLICANSLTGIATMDECIDSFVSRYESTKPKKRSSPAPSDALFITESSQSQESGYQQMLRKSLLEYLEQMIPILKDIAAADEAVKSEVDKSRQLLQEIGQKAAPAKKIFDAGVAARLGLPIPDLTKPEHIVRLTENSDIEASVAPLMPAHLTLLFPEVFLRENPGFDSLLGNPPWDATILKEDRWWAMHSPGLMGLKTAARHEAIKRLQAARPDLSSVFENEKRNVELVRDAILALGFPGLGRGNVDLYQPFAWRFYRLLRKGGSAGVVLPRGALVGSALKEWREEILDSARFQSVAVLVNNGKWIFDAVHGQYTLAGVVFSKTQPGTLSFGGPFASANDFNSGVLKMAHATPEEFKTWSSNLAFPVLPDENSSSVLTQLRKSPSFYEHGHTWELLPSRGDLLDANLFDETDTEGFLNEDSKIAIWAGSSFNIWDPNFGPRVASVDKNAYRKRYAEKLSRASTQKRSIFSGMTFSENSLPIDHCRISLRWITNPTNTRTAIVSLIPPKVATTDAASVFFRRTGEPKHEAFVLGVMSSIPFDWQARRWVDQNLTFEVLSTLTIPDFRNSSHLVERVTRLSARIAAVDERYEKWASKIGVSVSSVNSGTEKDELIAELDALVSLLYGLKENQVQHIFETFHRGWDFQPRLDAVLRHYSNWKDQV